MTFTLLEKAVRSQFILLHRYDGETDQQWQQRSRNSHRLTCDPVEGTVKGPVKGMAIMVFLGLLEEYRMDEDEAAIFLGIESMKVSRYIHLFQKYYEQAVRIRKLGGRLKPDSPAGRCYHKAGMVRGWLKMNA
jgi:hypothetical protein